LLLSGPIQDLYWAHDTSQLKFLTTMDEKKMLIEKHEIDHLIILEFTREFSRLQPAGLLKNTLLTVWD
jgi:FAD synthase